MLTNRSIAIPTFNLLLTIKGTKSQRTRSQSNSGLRQQRAQHSDLERAAIGETVSVRMHICFGILYPMKALPAPRQPHLCCCLGCHDTGLEMRAPVCKHAGLWIIAYLCAAVYLCGVQELKD